jgi:glycerophosphoryl diester phosphodiesterase
LKATSRPLLLGHRGVRPLWRFGVDRPQPKQPAENTIAAFEYALACGCDGFEFDLRFTRDRRVVLCHDPQIDGKDVATTDYSDFRRAGNELACFEDALARFANRAYLDIELKVGGDEAAIVAALHASPPKYSYVVSSFLPDVLLRTHEIDADVPLGYICEHRRDAGRWTELPIAAFIPHHRLVSSGLIEEVHGRGLKLLTWTVNHKRELLRLASWGVDGLISDDPGLLSRTFPRTQE